MEKHRVFGIDIIRVVCALLIFMRHSITMYDCSYFNDTINNLILATTSPVMSMFFILSGVSIFYSAFDETKEWDYMAIKRFYVKKLIQILPTYLIIHCLWLFMSSDSFLRWAFLTPLDLSGLQAAYPNIFGIIHFGGTWFISCLLMAYFVFPILKALFYRLSENKVYILTAILTVFLIYLPITVEHYALGFNYSNPVFRCLEFTLGTLIGYTSINLEKRILLHNSKVLVLIAGTLPIGSVTVLLFLLANPIGIQIAKDSISLTSIFMYPLFLIILCCCFILRSDYLEHCKPLLFFSNLIYYFFMLQLVLWTISRYIINTASSITGVELNTNTGKLLISFSLCVLLSIILAKLVARPIKNYCFKRFRIFQSSVK